MHRRLSFFPVLLAGAVAVLLSVSVGTFLGHGDGAALIASEARAQGNTASDMRAAGPMPSLAPIVKLLRPVVVNINSRFKPRKRVAQRGSPHAIPRLDPRQQNPDEDDQGGGEEQDPMERFFRHFGHGGPQPQDESERQGLGSGFLIGDGLVLTNNHVVEIEDEQHPGKYRAMDEIKVITDETATGGAREFVAKVVGADAKSDVALLRIEGKDVSQLKYATLGDSDAVEVGDYVIAIGEPFGLQATVTAGIISAKERSQFGNPYSDYLQTDASINPGNSGGPLFNLKGEVVGINAAIINGANTIGFAIPVAVVKQILPQLQKNGKVSRGYLGVQPQAITADMVDQLGLKSTRGALLADVVKDGPAAAAGLRPGDVVVGLNGRPVSDNNQLTRDVGAVMPGSMLKLDVIREGKPRSFEFKVSPRPDETEEVAQSKGDKGQSESAEGDLLGLQVEDLTPDLARRARVEAGTKGAVVLDVTPDSPASHAGIEPGFVVLEVNRKEIVSAADYRKAVKSLKKGDTALVRVKSGPGTQYLPVRVK